MTGVEVTLGTLAGVVVGVLITVLSVALIARLAPDHRFGGPPHVPPSAEVLDAERRAAPPTRTTANHRRPR